MSSLTFKIVMCHQGGNSYYAFKVSFNLKNMKCLLNILIKCLFNIQKKLLPLPIWVTRSLCFIDIYLSINELLGAPAVCAATGMSWKQYQSVQTMHRSVYIFTLWPVQGLKNFQLTIMDSVIEIYIQYIMKNSDYQLIDCIFLLTFQIN